MTPAVWRPIKVPPLCCLTAPVVRRPRAGESQGAPSAGLWGVSSPCHLSDQHSQRWLGQEGERNQLLSEGRNLESSRAL